MKLLTQKTSLTPSENREKRREFLRTVTTGVAGIFTLQFFGLTSLTSLFSSSSSAAKELPLPPGKQPVPATDPVATAIGYASDATKIDFKKYPKRKEAAQKNNFCGNCALYTSENEGWGRCSMLTSGVVNAKGWCGSWSKRA